MHSDTGFPLEQVLCRPPRLRRHKHDDERLRLDGWMYRRIDFGRPQRDLCGRAAVLDHSISPVEPVSRVSNMIQTAKPPRKSSLLWQPEPSRAKSIGVSVLFYYESVCCAAATFGLARLSFWRPQSAMRKPIVQSAKTSKTTGDARCEAAATSWVWAWHWTSYQNAENWDRAHQPRVPALRMNVRTTYRP